VTRLIAAVLLAGAAAGCRSDGTSASGTVAVTTYAGDRLAPGTRVITSRPTGEVIDDTATGALATETLDADPDSLVTAVFGTLALTTTVPASGAIDLHGPPPESTSILVVGVIDVDAPVRADATRYDIDLGCVTLSTQTLPHSSNVTACSLGTDGNLDVLVSAYGPDLLAIAGGRVPLVDEHAVFAAGAWTEPAPVPLTVTGVEAEVSATYYVDGNAYAAPLPDGVDSSVVVADTGTARYERHVPGLATPATIAATDFLAPGDGDATVFRTGEWTAVMPPQSAMPAPPDTLDAPAGDTVQLSVDSSELDGFEAARAAGFHTTSIVKVPSDGTLRTTATP
jgi:hypothetical protein